MASRATGGLPGMRLKCIDLKPNSGGYLGMAGALEQRLHEVLDELGHIGVVLPGSISARTTRCQRQGCHCRSDPAVLHGPYETWTWRPDGTAVTRTLTDDQSERLKPYSEAHRRLKQLVAELERLSLELIKQAEDIDLGYPANVGDRQAKAGN